MYLQRCGGRDLGAACLLAFLAVTNNDGGGGGEGALAGLTIARR